MSRKRKIYAAAFKAKAALFEQIGRLKMEVDWLKKSCPVRVKSGVSWSMQTMRIL